MSMPDVLMMIGVSLMIAAFAFILLSTTDSTIESRMAARKAKYIIKVDSSSYYVDSYTQSNNVLTFHDIWKNVDVTIINQSFTVKNNQ